MGASSAGTMAARRHGAIMPASSGSGDFPIEKPMEMQNHRVRAEAPSSSENPVVALQFPFSSAHTSDLRITHIDIEHRAIAREKARSEVEVVPAARRAL